MSAFLFAFIATILVATGARDQATVAALSARNGPRPGLLILAWLVSAASAAAVVFAAAEIAPLFHGGARRLLAAMALVLAAIELVVLRPRAVPAEPTHSLGATAFVLLVHQLTDAARFVVFGVAVALAAPFSAGLGGAIGGGIALTGAWLAGSAYPAAARLVLLRRIVAGALLVVGFYVGWGPLLGR